MEKLKERLERLGVSQSELSRMTGLSVMTIHRTVKGTQVNAPTNSWLIDVTLNLVEHQGPEMRMKLNKYGTKLYIEQTLGIGILWLPTLHGS